MKKVSESSVKYFAAEPRQAGRANRWSVQSMARELELSRKVVEAVLEAREHLWQGKYLKTINETLDKMLD